MILASFLLYISVFLLAGGCLFLYQKTTRKIFLILGLILPIWLAVARYGVGTDWFNYQAMYEELVAAGLPNMVWALTYGSLEPATFLLAKISDFFHLGFIGFLGIYALFTVVFAWLAFKKIWPEKSWLLMTLFLFIIFPMTFNAVRQGAAISLIAYAVACLLDKQYIRFIWVTVFATFFHFSALIFLVLLIPAILYKIKHFSEKYILNYSPLILAILCSGIALLFYGGKLVPMFSKFSETLFTIGIQLSAKILVLAVTFWLSLLVFFILFFYFKKKSISTWREYLLFFLSIVGLGISTLGVTSAYLSRFNNYFMLFVMIVLSYAIYKLNSLKKLLPERNLNLCMICGAVFYFLVVYGLMGVDEVIPYGSWLAIGGIW